MDATEIRKKLATKASVANTSGPRLKIVPQAPQPVLPEASDSPASETVPQDPDEDLKLADRHAFASPPLDERSGEGGGYAFTDDEPARDVGGEIGRRGVRFNAWQMAWALTGAVLVTAGATWVTLANSSR